MTEWPKVVGCKPIDANLRRFESCSCYDSFCWKEGCSLQLLASAKQSGSASARPRSNASFQGKECWLLLCRCQAFFRWKKYCSQREQAWASGYASATRSALQTPRLPTTSGALPPKKGGRIEKRIAPLLAGPDREAMSWKSIILFYFNNSYGEMVNALR